MAIIFILAYHGISAMRSLFDTFGMRRASLMCTERIYRLLMKWDSYEQQKGN